MLGSYRVYDADAHVILAPAMWEDLPEKYVPRRPRPATFSDSGDLAAYTSGWLIEGRVEPHILGPGLQPANTPAWVIEGRHRDTHTLMNPEGRVRELDQMGIDSVLTSRAPRREHSFDRVRGARQHLAAGRKDVATPPFRL